MTDLWSRLDAIIEELASVTDIRAAAVVRRDGLIITHTLPDGVDPKIVAAMTAAIVGTSEMATVQLDQGRFNRALIESHQHGSGGRGPPRRPRLQGCESRARAHGLGTRGETRGRGPQRRRRSLK